jgi:hypothetical protein
MLVITPLAPGLIEKAACTEASETGLLKLRRIRLSVGTSLCPLLKFVVSVVGSVFS